MGGHQNGIGIGRLRTLAAELITTSGTCRSLAVAAVIVVALVLPIDFDLAVAAVIVIALVLRIDFDLAAVVDSTRRRAANRSVL